MHLTWKKALTAARKVQAVVQNVAHWQQRREALWKVRFVVAVQGNRCLSHSRSLSVLVLYLWSWVFAFWDIFFWSSHRQGCVSWKRSNLYWISSMCEHRSHTGFVSAQQLCVQVIWGMKECHVFDVLCLWLPWSKDSHFHKCYLPKTLQFQSAAQKKSSRLFPRLIQQISCALIEPTILCPFHPTHRLWLRNLFSSHIHFFKSPLVSHVIMWHIFSVSEFTSTPWWQQIACPNQHRQLKRHWICPCPWRYCA